MRRYRLGAHTKTELKVHVIWIPKYRKRVLIGEVAERPRDVLRQIALGHEIEIITGKVSSDHSHIITDEMIQEYIEEIVLPVFISQSSFGVPARCYF